MNIKMIDLLNRGDKNCRKILEIIREIKKYNVKGIEKTFLEGFCYDFAHILWRNVPETTIFFVLEKRHYVVENSGRFFDITGEVFLKEGLTLEADEIGVSS